MPYASLGFVQKLTLLALLDDGHVAGAERIASLDAGLRSEPLAPTDEASEALVRNLYEAGVLNVDPDGDIKAFDRAAGYLIKDFPACAGYPMSRWKPAYAALATHCTRRCTRNCPAVFSRPGKASCMP